MEQQNPFSWIPIYTELADKLLEYRNNRTELIEIIKRIFKNLGKELPTLELNNEIEDIDPFTVFGLFNKGLTDANRTSILWGFADELGLTSPVPTSFDGVPRLNNQKATYYCFKDNRDEGDIERLWQTFICALDYVHSPSESAKAAFIDIYNKVLKQKCIKWNITIGLYWIRPYDFINLDTCNKKFIDYAMHDVFKTFGSFKKVLRGDEYIDLINKLKERLQNTDEYQTFPELSHQAFQYKPPVDKSRRYWLFAPGESAKMWDTFYENEEMRVGWKNEFDAGDLGQYQSKAEITQKVQSTDVKGDLTHITHALWQFSHEIKVGDIIFAKKGTDKIVGRGEVTGNYVYDDSNFNYPHSRDVDWTHKGEWNNPGKSILKALTEITEQEEIQKFENLFIDQNDWFPKEEEYHPGITQSQWLDLLNNAAVFTKDALQMMAEFYAFGQMATCKQLSIKYHKSFNTYNSGSSYLAKRIAKATQCPVMPDKLSKNSKWWPILYVGRRVTKEDLDGTYLWKIRDELYAALTEFNILNYLETLENNMYSNADEANTYSNVDFHAEVFMNPSELDELLGLLRYKKNIILQGAPGVGKTFCAKRLAYVMMGMEDDKRIEMIQFHQSYCYEDFILGYKPNDNNGFSLKKGIFYQFCQKASTDPENDYFFIIDEINRGNMSKIFGELLMSIEKDYRGKSINLANDMDFSVPKNLYIIGMMNTADRSLAMIDYALRRRFSFFDMAPKFDSSQFKKYQDELQNHAFNQVVSCICELNAEIAADDTLGDGFTIGHSYFCNGIEVENIEPWLKSILKFEIIPMLREYWFDDKDKFKNWSDRLNKIIEQCLTTE